MQWGFCIVSIFPFNDMGTEGTMHTSGRIGCMSCVWQAVASMCIVFQCVCWFLNLNNCHGGALTKKVEMVEV